VLYHRAARPAAAVLGGDDPGPDPAATAWLRRNRNRYFTPEEAAAIDHGWLGQRTMPTGGSDIEALAARVVANIAAARAELPGTDDPITGTRATGS
jgi:hypothetical protein